ncbi:hypothetical protein LTR85_008954 [Meristemomyces frigidus]|nr:hypothetical protein LTR85_008954 [Meristemomyces frigidus]
MADDWKKSLSFTERLTETAKMQQIVEGLELNPRQTEYGELCAKTIQLLLSSAPTGAKEDHHVDEHIFPNMPSTGTAIGRYIDAQHHSDGLFSEVFKAVDPEVQSGDWKPSLVALKMTTPSSMTAPHDSRREARILTAVKGSHVIPLLETFQQAGGHFVLAFPFMPYGLDSLLQRKELTDSSRQSILRGLFSGLAHVHSLGIIHRDVKPANIMLSSPAGPAYLADFGIAWSPTDPASEPPSEKILDVGTTCYRPPELLFGHQAYGTKLDMWAAGCVAAQLVCLNGKTLFDAGDLGSELALIKSIFETLGTPDLKVWPEVAGFHDWGKMKFTEYPGKPWAEILPGAEANLMDLKASTPTAFKRHVPFLCLRATQKRRIFQISHPERGPNVSSAMTTDYFASLPAELRITIYGFSLPAGKRLCTPYPVQSISCPAPAHSRQGSIQTSPSQADVPSEALQFYEKAALLLVNRMIYKEALAVLHKSNTFSFTKIAFCTKDPAKQATAPKLDVLVHLHLSCLEMSEMCKREALNRLNPCTACGLCVYGLRNVIASLPHLRSIVVEYNTTGKNLDAFRTFKEALQTLTGSKTSFSCVGIGQYKLEGMELFKTIDFTLNNTKLATMWAAIICPRPNTPSYMDLDDPLVRTHLIRPSVSFMKKALVMLHDRHGPLPDAATPPDGFYIPAPIASVWPKDVPVNIRDLGLVERVGFIEEVDNVVHDCLERWNTHALTWVPKW